MSSLFFIIFSDVYIVHFFWIKIDVILKFCFVYSWGHIRKGSREMMMNNDDNNNDNDNDLIKLFMKNLPSQNPATIKFAPRTCRGNVEHRLDY